MPKPVEIEPASHVLTLVTSCGADFQKYVEGGVDAATLVQATRGAFATFKQGIKGTTPNFLPYLSSEDNKPGFKTYLEGEEEESFNESGYTTRPFFLEDMRRHIEKSITRELPDDVPFPCKVTLIKSYQGAWSGLAKTCFKSVKESTLNCLTMQVEEKFGPYTALKNRIMSLVTQLIAIQEEKCMQYLDVVLQIETLPFTQNTFYYTSCRDKWLAKYKAAREQKESLSVAAKSGFPDPPRPGPDSSSSGGPFPLSLSSEPPLRRTLDEVSTTELPFTTASSVEAAAKLSVFGNSGPPVQPHGVDISPFIGGFTKSEVCNFPEKSFEEMRVEALTARRPIKKAPNLKMKARATIPSAIVQSDASEQDYNDALSALAKIGITGLTKEDLGRLQPSDQYTRELNVMAQVRAYFGISYRRVIDNVPLIIDYMFVQALGKELQSFLISGLALGTADATLKCAAYLAEDPETRALREEVVARRRRLHDVALELRKIM